MGSNMFSVSVMAVFYVGLLTLGYCFYAIASKVDVPIKVKIPGEWVGEITSSPCANVQEQPLVVTPQLIEKARENKYQNVVKKNDVMKTILWLSVLR